MTTHYTPTNEGGMSFTSTRRPGEVRIPNYVYDIWMPLLGIEAIGVYAVYCRLEREGTVKAMSQQRIAQEMRIGVNRLKKTNDLLKRYGFIDIRQPESYEKLMHYTTEITVHDPPRTASAATIRELKHPKGYETLCPWLTETEPQPIGNAGDTNESCADQSNGNANVAPPVFAPSVVAEEPPLADSPPVVDSQDDDPEIAETAAMFKTPTASQEAPEKRIERLRDELGTDPLQVAAVVAENRATVAHPDGGDASKDGDPWMDRPVREWCAFIRLPYENSRVAYLATELSHIAVEVHASAEQTGEAIRKMTLSPSCEWLRTAHDPKHTGFAGTLLNVLNGQELPEGKANGASGGRAPREQVISSDMVVM